MTSERRWLRATHRWLRLLLRLYPADFREEFGADLIDTYLERCRVALERGGVPSLLMIWMRALMDSTRNGLGERFSPSTRWRPGDWGRDIQLVLRRLMRAPVFALAMLGTLTVGLGAFAIVYTVTNKVLLAPLPYESPDDLYFVWRNYTWINFDRGWMAGTDIAALDTAGGAIQGVVGMQRQTVTLAIGDGEPMQAAMMVTEPDFFPLINTTPVLGRLFAPEEVGPGREPTVVLGHDIWRTHFGSDTAIGGTVVRINNSPHTVIGVLRPDFRFARLSSEGRPQAADIWITDPDDPLAGGPYDGSYAALLRARSGATAEEVAATVSTVAAMIDERDMQGRGLKLYPLRMKDDLVSGVRPAIIVLAMAGVVLILVLTANMATLLLARAASREHEFAISRALGADHFGIVRSMLLEGGLLGMLGGIGGALVALWGTKVLVSLAPADLPLRETIAVDWSIALVVVGIGALLGLLAGAVPALWATRSNLAALLANANVRGGGGGDGKLRRGMVVAQIALSFVLLIAGGLVVRSFEQLLRAQPGFDSTNVLTFTLRLTGFDYTDPSVREMHERFQRELESIPGVRSASAVSSLPLTASASQTTITLPGAPGNTGIKDEDSPLIDHIRVRPGYFETMGIRLLNGRTFSHGWQVGGPSETVIDRTLADRFHPGGTAVGATLSIGGNEHTIIGVVDHARQYDMHENGKGQVYLLNDVDPYGTMSWVVRGDQSPEMIVSSIRQAIAGIDPRLAISQLRTMEQIEGESRRQQHVSAVLISGFALGALLLTSMGLFGVIAGTVTRRRHELAIRMALGADSRRVLGMVLREGGLLVAAGLLLAVPAIYFSPRALQGILINVSPFDPLTLLLVALGLITIAMLACYIPARRAAGIEPARLLGSE